MPSHAIIAWCFTAGVLVHNLEEARALPAWSLGERRWYRPVDAWEFRVGVIVVSALLLACALWVTEMPDGRAARLAFSGYAIAMMLNAIVPHLALSLLEGRYMPGTATGIAFNIPLGGWWLARMQGDGVATRDLVIAGVIGSAVLLAMIPLSFAFARSLRPRS